MNVREVLSQLDEPGALDRVRAELRGRRDQLVKAAEQCLIADSTDRENVLLYLRDGHLPSRPTTVEEVLKNFVSSALSYAVLRRRLARHVGGAPTAATIAKALAAEYGETRFLSYAFWAPQALRSLALDVAAVRRLTERTIGAKPFDSRVLGVVHDGAKQIEQATKAGLAAFYAEVEKNLTTPESAWSYLERFTRDVRQVGPPLAADFFKNVGFHVFVKPDVHLLRELPKLSRANGRLSARDSLTLGWLLATKLGVSAFQLDYTLYAWGRHGARSLRATC